MVVKFNYLLFNPLFKFNHFKIKITIYNENIIQPFILFKFQLTVKIRQIT